MLAERGFWAHNFQQKANGQPCDIIACRNNVPYLIDAKVCSTYEGFRLDRVEENQILAMKKFYSCGNGVGWFAVKLPDESIYMIPLQRMLRAKKSSLSEKEIRYWGTEFERWDELCT